MAIVRQWIPAFAGMTRGSASVLSFSRLPQFDRFPHAGPAKTAEKHSPRSPAEILSDRRARNHFPTRPPPCQHPVMRTATRPPPALPAAQGDTRRRVWLSRSRSPHTGHPKKPLRRGRAAQGDTVLELGGASTQQRGFACFCGRFPLGARPFDGRMGPVGGRLPFGIAGRVRAVRPPRPAFPAPPSPTHPENLRHGIRPRGESGQKTSGPNRLAGKNVK